MNSVVIINQTTGFLTIDVANAFMEQYDDVVLMAGSISDVPRLDSRIKIHKIIKYNRRSVLKRLLTWIYATIQIAFALSLKYRHYEICFFTNPPSSYFPILFLRKRVYRIVIYDLFPDSLKVVNMSEKHFIYKWWSKVNVKAFSNAKKLITLSDSMAKAVNMYTDKSKIEIIPNWPSREYYPTGSGHNMFLNENDLTNKFVILYSGNLGFDYNMDVLIDVANNLRYIEEIKFVIIGEGGKKRLMMDMSRKLKLDNLLFLPYQPVAKLNDIFTSAGISVVALGDEQLDVSMPSKTYDLIAARSPLLCIAGKRSELAEFVKVYKNGMCFEKSEIEEISNFILRCFNDKNYRTFLSDNSYRASLLFTKANAKKYV